MELDLGAATGMDVGHDTVTGQDPGTWCGDWVSNR